MILQGEVDAAVKELIALKADYKSLTGKDYKPGAAPTVQKSSPEPAASSPSGAADLYAKVAAQGDKVRNLKSQKASKVRAYNWPFLLMCPQQS